VSDLYCKKFYFQDMSSLSPSSSLSQIFFPSFNSKSNCGRWKLLKRSSYYTNIIIGLSSGVIGSYARIGFTLSLCNLGLDRHSNTLGNTMKLEKKLSE